jgi:hypothetical protein
MRGRSGANSHAAAAAATPNRSQRLHRIPNRPLATLNHNAQERTAGDRSCNCNALDGSVTMFLFLV